ncbi:MAG: hypothetical protein ACYTFK_13320 [Planctomycetota bacterium]|jgi:hypothetical protein
MKTNRNAPESFIFALLVLAFSASTLQAGLYTQSSGLYTQGTGLYTQDSGLYSQGIGLYSQGTGLYTQGIGLYTQDSGLYTQSSGLYTQNSGLYTQDSGLYTQSSGLYTQGSGLYRPGSGLYTPGSGLYPGGSGSYEPSDPTYPGAPEPEPPPLPSGTYSGGTGDPNDPYIIDNPNDLGDIGNFPNDWSKYFVLTSDINLADFPPGQFNLIGDCQDALCFDGLPFTGVFDGRGYVISNFTYQASKQDNVGLFRALGSGGIIKNLGLINVDILGRANTGSLVGTVIGGQCQNSYAIGQVMGADKVGGLVGSNEFIPEDVPVTDINDANAGSILNCFFQGQVLANANTGGLVGMNNGTIRQSYAIGRASPQIMLVAS